MGGLDPEQRRLNCYEEVLPDWGEENAIGYKQLTIRGFEALTVEPLREMTE